MYRLEGAAAKVWTGADACLGQIEEMGSATRHTSRRSDLISENGQAESEPCRDSRITIEVRVRNLKQRAALFAIFAGASIWIAPSYAEEIDQPVYEIYGCRYDSEGEEWEVEAGYYVIERGALREHRNGETLLEGHECRWYNQSEDCGDSDHKPGGNKMNHAHVEAGADYPTQALGNYDAVTSDEAEKFWSVAIAYAGDDGVAQLPLNVLDDEGAFVIEWGEPDYHYNCYGLAFCSLLGEYCLLIDDEKGSPYNGAGVVLHAECNEQYPVTDVCGTVMHMSGSHANFVESMWTACRMNIASLEFKYRDSQVFIFDYEYPGRPNDRDFFGNTPEYWEMD